MRWSKSKGRWKFGYPLQFRKIMGTDPDDIPHHLIPASFFEKLLPGMQEIIESGFHPYMAKNGINVPKIIRGKSFHNGGHKNYNDWALKELNKAIRDNGDNAYEGAVKFSEKARDEVDYAVKYLKDAIEELTIDQYWVKYVLKGKRPPLP